MAVEARPELVGRRFVCASGSESLELGGISRWSWRAGVIRAVSTRETDSPGLAVCVEWDGEAAAERHWRRLKEEWEVFLLEHELVWARRRNITSQENSSLQPALVFRPLIGQACVGGVSVVEFLSDRQLEFYTEQEELRPYEEGEVDDSALREDSSSREQVQAWLRQRQLQHILQLGHDCVKGLRVKVFRHDSKPQWLSGIVTHHDHNSRTMTVLSDQVSEPLSVDQVLIQVVFLDDISQLLLMGETNITKRRPHMNKINRTILAYSTGPVQRKQPQLCQQDSNCNQAEDETEAMREEVRADSSKSRFNHGERKRRKVVEVEEEDEKEKRRVGLKRLKGGCNSDMSDCSDSESCMQQEMSCDIGSRSLQKKRCALNRPADRETGHSPAGRVGQDFKGGELSHSQLAELEEVGTSPPSKFHSPGPSCNGAFQGTGVQEQQGIVGPDCDKIEEERGDGTIEMEDRSEGASQEDSEAVSALLASQESEQLVSMETTCVLLHTSPPECEGVEGDQEIPVNDPEVRGSVFTHPEVVTPISDSAASVEEEPRGALTHSPVMPCNADVDAGKGAKLSQPTGDSSPEHEAVPPLKISHKPSEHPSPCYSPEIISKHPVVSEVSRLRRNASPETFRIKDSSSAAKSITEKTTTPGPKVTCTSVLDHSHTSSLSPTDQPAQSRTPPQHLSSAVDKPTKSPLIIDRNEHFTVYRDPTLVRKETESHRSYIQPAHTSPNPHPKHHLKSPSSSPNLTSTSSHSKILSPTPHLSPLSLTSQSPLCSPHPSIPHPHLLPSLLPGLPPSTALLAGHTRLGPLGLPHHPLALQATPSLLGQSPGTSHLAPLGLYPLLWPPFSNGAHNYGLGLQGSKWNHPESAEMSEGNLRRNTPSPWLPQPTPVTSAESQGLRPPLPVRPSSADPQTVSRAIQPSNPTSKTTEELERRAFTETQNCVHAPMKADLERVRAVGKNEPSYRPVASESPADRPKQPRVVYDLTGDRTSHYQEESRRILKESIEVAPFTAKIGSEKDPRYPKSPTLHSKDREKERDREREREREMHMFKHSLPPRPQSTHPSPTQTNYYTPMTGGVENKPSARRAPPSKELYERLSGPNTAASVLHSPSTQSTVKARPPPLVKRHPEKEEGLLGKIAEQLACKANSLVSVESAELSSIERKGSTTSLVSVSNSSSRVVPSLHRAPIFHPPAPPILASKEAGQGRLSPPTLTPIQPMSLSGKGKNQQRPPTLIPELRHGAVAGKRMAPEPISVTSQAYDLQRGGVLHNRERVVGGHTTNGGVVTPQSATASVIVRPSGYVHTPVNYSITDRSLHQPHCEHVQTFESVPNTHLKESSVQCKRGVLWTPMDTVHPINMVTSKQDVNVPLNMTTKNISTTHFANRGIKYSSIDIPHSGVDIISEQCKKNEVGTVQPKFDLSSTICCPTGDLPHVKKRRAGLPAPEPRHNTHAVQSLHTTHTLNSTKSVLHTSHSRYSTYTTHSTHTICTAHTLERDKESLFNPPKCPRLFSEVTGVRVTNKPSSMTKTQSPAPPPNTNQSAQSGQSNYHKLKKAWLTRHSEQDRGNDTSQTTGCSQMDTTLTSTSNVSLPTNQEVNGLENKWSIQQGKEGSLDNRKSNSLDRRCFPEDRKSNGSDTMSKTEHKKPVMGDRKATLEDIKPVMDRNGNFDDKKTSSQDKKLCANERKPSTVPIKTEKDNRGDTQISQSSFESGDSGNESESRKSDSGGKRQLKPKLLKKQNDQQKKRGENDKEEHEEVEEEEGKTNGTLRTTKEKSQHRLPSSNGIPRSVLKDWRKVKKLKQSGEAFLQDDSCAEIGANVQKCRECRLDRSRKAQEPAVSPVFCRFYYFRRLSYSKNGVVRVDGFSVAEHSDEDAVKVWMSGFEDVEDKDKREIELNTAKYILTLIGDQFCQLVKTENIAVTWVKKDSQVLWKRAVRGVREMCDACEATLFNMHWACHKCGFVVCMDCYKARERKSAKDKELYTWVRCVKNQPHDIKNLMATQIVPEIVLAGLQSFMHSIRREYGILSHCSCSGNSVFSPKPITTYDFSQLSAKAQCDSKNQQSSPQVPDQQRSAQDAAHKTPTERRGKPECDRVEALGRKSSSPEQGSTLRDLLTSTAGKLRLGSSGPGIAFAPVYNNSDQNTQNTRMPNLLDDIIASVVEKKIPASKMVKLGLKQDLLAEEEAELGLEVVKSNQIPFADPHASVPHDWLGIHRLLWLKDHRHLGNQRLFKENWTQEQPVLVSGLHKSLNVSLWKPEHFSQEFSALHSDIYNCRDGSITNSRVKEFWDGFEDVSKRPKSPKGDPAVYRLKDWPSGEEFLALMPSRYEDVMSALPVPEYTGPDGSLNLASRLPSFFIRPDLGPRLCCAHGVTACPEQDFGTSNLHVEISDTMSILVYVGIAKGNGALSKTGVLKLLEREGLDESAKKRLRDSGETPGALWHIFLSKDLQKIQDFLQTLSAEHAEADVEADSDAEWDSEADPLREGGWYLSPRLRQRLLKEHGVGSRTLLQFYGDAVIIPAGALHQVMNLHSCIQVNVDFVSPEHAHNSYYLTQELRPLKDQVNYEDKLQIKNIIYHSVKDAVATLGRHLKEQSTLEEVKEEES